MNEKDDIKTIELELLNTTADKTQQEESAPAAADTTLREELKATEQKALSRLKKIKDTVSEEEQTPTGALTLRKILGGDILSTDMVRRQIWLFLLIMVFTVTYVAVRYQCQQDLIKIDRLNRELKDAKYKALSSSSTLTEHCRESKVLELLKQNRDSLLKVSDQPPYIVTRNE
jgi:hypothetical protein